jgi:hypothetical protein
VRTLDDEMNNTSLILLFELELLSTMPGKHGKVANETEVPRRTLLDALRTESDLASTTDLSFVEPTLEICELVTVSPRPA